MKTIAHDILHDCIVTIFGTIAPNAQDWADYASFLTSNVGHRQRILIIADGMLTNTQRRELEHILGPAQQRDRRVAVIAQSTFVTGIIMGLSKVDPTFRVFPPPDLQKAFEYLNMPLAFYPSAKKMINRLRPSIGLAPWGWL